MNAVRHSGIFEFLSLKTGVSETRLIEKLRNMGVPEFISYVESVPTRLCIRDMVLADDLSDSRGVVMIRQGVPIGKHFTMLLERYFKEPSFKTSELVLNVDDSVLRSYQTSLRIRIISLYEASVSRQSRHSEYLKYWINESAVFNDNINSFFKGMVANVKGVSTTLGVLRVCTDDDDLLHEASVILSLSMKICSLLQAKKKINTENMALVYKLAYGAFFFYFLLREKSNQVRDLQIEDSHDLIRYYKKSREADLPLFAKNSKNSFIVKLLVTQHIFLALLEKNKLSANSMDAHRMMHYLADMGYADQGAANILSEIFLPAKKQSLLEYAVRIKGQCSENPVIWGIAGDMMPVRVICDKHDCEKAGNHKTFIPSDIKICTDRMFCTKIKAGVYYRCESLTQKMEEFYSSIAEKKAN